MRGEQLVCVCVYTGGAYGVYCRVSLHAWVTTAGGPGQRGVAGECRPFARYRPLDRRLARSRRFALRRSNLGIGMSHKWGTSTKVGDSFPNKAVDIGFVGLDPANRKMCARPLPRRRTPPR